MTENALELHEKVLSLSSAERAALVELLLASFEPESPTQRAWARLASKRREDVRSGKVLMVSGEDALARIRAKIA